MEISFTASLLLSLKQVSGRSFFKAELAVIKLVVSSVNAKKQINTLELSEIAQAIKHLPTGLLQLVPTKTSEKFLLFPEISTKFGSRSFNDKFANITNIFFS